MKKNGFLDRKGVFEGFLKVSIDIKKGLKPNKGKSNGFKGNFEGSGGIFKRKLWMEEGFKASFFKTTVGLCEYISEMDPLEKWTQQGFKNSHIFSKFVS